MSSQNTKIQPASLDLAKSYNLAVKSVSAEGKFLSGTSGFPIDSTVEFIQEIIDNNWSQFYAVEGDRVIGWCDIIPRKQEFFAHVGILGMGVIKEFRGQGIGEKLLETTLADAQTKGIEKVELEVYASNIPAQNLYRKFGFEVEGVKKKSKKSQGEYEDVIIMGLWLKE